MHYSSLAQDAFVVAIGALALAPTAAAHGHVKEISVNGKTYPGAVPNWYYTGSTPATAGWLALNQDNGFVEPNSFGTSDIACHKSAKSTSTSIPVKAGDTLKLQWDTWPESHHGPVIDYLAKVNSHSPSNSPGSLSFFKIAEKGLVNGASPPGLWASDDLISESCLGSANEGCLLTSINRGRQLLERQDPHLPGTRLLRPPSRDHRSPQCWQPQRCPELPSGRYHTASRLGQRS